MAFSDQLIVIGVTAIAALFIIAWTLKGNDDAKS